MAELGSCSLDSGKVLWLVGRGYVFLGLAGFDCFDFGPVKQTVSLVLFDTRGLFLSRRKKISRIG